MIHHDDKIPYPSLMLLGLGYICFGWLIGLNHGGEITWAIAWLGSVVWVIDESLTWYSPIAGAIAVILAIGLSSWALVFAVSIGAGLLIALKLVGWSLRAAIRDGLWVGGITVVLLTLPMWLSVRPEGYGALIALGQYVIALTLMVGMAGSGLGSISWLQMRHHGFAWQRILWTIGGTTAFSLLVGGLVGVAMRS